MSTNSLVRAFCGVTTGLALVCAGCGGSDDGSRSAESQTTTAVVAESSQAYRDQVTAIVRVTDDARGSFHDAPGGERLVRSARQLARASQAAAREVEELTPPAALNELNRDLAESYRRWETALDRELRRKPVSTARLGDVVREYGQATDRVYEEVLIAP